MITDIIGGITSLGGKIAGAVKAKQDMKKEVNKEQLGYLKEQMTSFVFTCAALTFIIPTMVWILSPILKYLPFMPQILEDYQQIINTIGMERIFYIITSLLGVGGITKGMGLLGRISMAKKRENTTREIKIKDKEIEKEKLIRGVVGDSYVKLEVNPKSIKKVKDFVNQFAKYCIKVEQRFGLPAVAVLAHAANETGWGRSILWGYNDKKEKVNTNNIFNIKTGSTWTGKKAVRKVWEVKEGEDTTEISWFRVYDDYQDSFDDYGKLLITKSRYKPLNDADDPEEYADQLYKCGYFTDTKGSETIKSIMKKHFIYET